MALIVSILNGMVNNISNSLKIYKTEYIEPIIEPIIFLLKGVYLFEIADVQVINI